MLTSWLLLLLLLLLLSLETVKVFLNRGTGWRRSWSRACGRGRSPGEALERQLLLLCKAETSATVDGGLGRFPLCPVRESVVPIGTSIAGQVPDIPLRHDRIGSDGKGRGWDGRKERRIGRKEDRKDRSLLFHSPAILAD